MVARVEPVAGCSSGAPRETDPLSRLETIGATQLEVTAVLGALIVYLTAKALVGSIVALERFTLPLGSRDGEQTLAGCHEIGAQRTQGLIGTDGHLVIGLSAAGTAGSTAVDGELRFVKAARQLIGAHRGRSFPQSALRQPARQGVAIAL